MPLRTFALGIGGGGARSAERAVSAIPHDLVENGTFTFIGAWEHASTIDVRRILSDYRLLPLYRFVEGRDVFPESDVGFREGAPFEAGHKPRTSSSRVVTRSEREIEIVFRHNEMEQRLFDRLAEVHGASSVRTEHPTPVGTSVDVAVSSSRGLIYFEIKPYLSARLCLREAVGQLLEYSRWPGTTEAVELVVVGDPEPDSDVAAYVAELRSRYSLPLLRKFVRPTSLTGLESPHSDYPCFRGTRSSTGTRHAVHYCRDRTLGCRPHDA